MSIGEIMMIMIIKQLKNVTDYEGNQNGDNEYNQNYSNDEDSDNGDEVNKYNQNDSDNEDNDNEMIIKKVIIQQKHKDHKK